MMDAFTIYMPFKGNMVIRFEIFDKLTRATSSKYHSEGPATVKDSLAAHYMTLLA